MTLHAAPTFISITGADASVDLAALVEVALLSPSVEVAFLYSPKRAGTGRYPHAAWIASTAAWLAGAGVRTALHLCGTAVDEFVGGDGSTSRELATLVGRVQLNFALDRAPFSVERLTQAIDSFGKPVIVQLNEANQPLVGIARPFLHFLHDSSGGRGLLPSGWTTAPANSFCGYAGGLGPSNIAAALPAIAAAADGRPYWIDCESSLRDDMDRFDLHKARAFIEAALSVPIAESATRKIWPVIHYSTKDVALVNAQTAAEAGCHGVFLISMSGDPKGVSRAARAVKAAYPGLMVGANLLSRDPVDDLEQCLRLGLDATWVDNAGFFDGDALPNGEILARLMKDWPGHQLFGGVDFKYQRSDPCGPASAAAAWSSGIIPCTTGPATGSAPDSEKLARFRAALPAGARLAVASGITPDNAAALAPPLTDILVATGVSRDEHHLDRVLLRSLVEVVTAIPAA